MTDSSETRPLPWALVPGALVHPDGTPCAQLEDRLVTGIELVRAGRTERLLLTGAETTPWGNEVRAMAAFCQSHGLEAAQWVCDGGGTRTRHSLIRAAELFGVRSAWICTQRYHLPRALYWARAAGIDAVGIPADRRPYRRAAAHHLREGVAWVRAVVERSLLP